MSQADFLNTITNILGLSVKKDEVLSDDIYDTIYTIIHWKYDKIHEWKLTTTRGGDYFGERKTKCLQALAWWANNLTFRGKHIVLANFDATMVTDCIDEAKLDYKDDQKDQEI